MSDFNQILSSIKGLNKIENLNPMQIEAIKEEHSNSNLIVASQTSSGKTLVAETYSLDCIVNKNKRVIYLSPLKALASEHYKSFKRKYEHQFGIKTALSTGDLDSSSKQLSNYHMIFLTYEKLDSLIRHRAEWLSTIGLVIIDEIHMLDSDRGPTIETSIVQLKMSNQNIKFIGLSATIPNANEIAKWLDAKLIVSDYRPVTLRKGVITDNMISFDDLTKYNVDKNDGPIEDIVRDTMQKQKQLLIFSNTRTNAQSLAKKLARITKESLSQRDLLHLSNAVELDLENTTDFDTSIFNLIKSGVAFHHAGIRSEVRELIEDEFRNGKIKAIVSTPTLAAGLNLPAYRVVIQSLYRHTENGMKSIPVKEYLQMCGRAGRKGYDSEGEAIAIAKDVNEQESIFARYVYASAENVESQLGYIPMLRMIMLGLISNDTIFDDNSLVNFFNNTYYAVCFNNLEELNYKIYKVLQELIEFEFVKVKDGHIGATEIGNRVAKLYIDPLSAYNIITKLKQLEDNVTNESILMIIANTFELKPYFKIPKGLERQVFEELQLNYKEFGLTFDDITADYDIVQKFFTAIILKDWINEVGEQELIDKFDILPGIMHNKINIAKWMAYSCSELSSIIQNTIGEKMSKRIERRLEFGIKEDLVTLVELPGIGRARARKLANSSIRTISDISKADPEILANIIGSKVFKNYLEFIKVFFNNILISTPNTCKYNCY